jgi:hypothetical protein
MCDCRCHLPYVDQGAFVDWWPINHACCDEPLALNAGDAGAHDVSGDGPGSPDPCPFPRFHLWRNHDSA